MADVPRVSGSPAYVAAHGIATKDASLVFEDAYALAQLVLLHAGGPLPTGKEIPISQARRLSAKGFAELHGVVPETWDVTFRPTLTSDGDIWRLPTYETRVSRVAGSRAKMFILASQEGVDLVLQHLERNAPKTGA